MRPRATDRSGHLVMQTGVWSERQVDERHGDMYNTMARPAGCASGTRWSGPSRHGGVGGAYVCSTVELGPRPGPAYPFPHTF
jgi:hypothetical protein